MAEKRKDRPLIRHGGDLRQSALTPEEGQAHVEKELIKLPPLPRPKERIQPSMPATRKPRKPDGDYNSHPPKPL